MEQAKSLLDGLLMEGGDGVANAVLGLGGKALNFLKSGAGIIFKGADEGGSLALGVRGTENLGATTNGELSAATNAGATGKYAQQSGGAYGLEGITTAEGTANSATVQGLKEQLIRENLANIAAQDSRLAAAVNGNAKGNLNFSIGTGSTAEADRLGQIWVGDGARLVGNQNACPGCLISADGARIYRPPQQKNSPFATTGVQANFVQQTSNGTVISNGHLNVTR
jgi:filamentous hemagglutinin